MNPLEIQLKALIKLFSATDTKYAILGGFAVLLYGEPRLTADIDVNISIGPKDIGPFLATAKNFGFYPIPSDIKSFIKNTGVIPFRFKKRKIFGTCDIIIAGNPIELAALKRARMRKIGNLRARFVTPEDLIIHKITSDRPRDIEDVKGILMRQKGKIDKKYILFWLNKISAVTKKTDLTKLFKNLI